MSKTSKLGLGFLDKVKKIGTLFEKPNPDIMTGRDLYNAYRGILRCYQRNIYVMCYDYRLSF
mgnify:CR=1 FL=1